MKKISKRTSASRKPSRKPRRRLAPHESALLAFARVAKKLGIRWYVFGAQAVNLHGFPRATADLDLTIDLGKHSPHELVKSLSTGVRRTPPDAL